MNPLKEAEMSIQARPIATLTRVTVSLTTEPGTVTIPSGAGSRPDAYEAGEVVISDQATSGVLPAATRTIAGPLSHDDAIALATAVLEGQRRAITHPQLHLLLAGAVLAFTGRPRGCTAVPQASTATPCPEGRQSRPGRAAESPAAGSHEPEPQP